MFSADEPTSLGFWSALKEAPGAGTQGLCYLFSSLLWAPQRAREALTHSGPQVLSELPGSEARISASLRLSRRQDGGVTGSYDLYFDNLSEIN